MRIIDIYVFLTAIFITYIKGGTPSQNFLERGSAMTRATFVIFWPKTELASFIDWWALFSPGLVLIAAALLANKKPNLFFLPQYKCFYWQPLFELLLVFFINILDLLIISNAMSFFLNFYENLKIFKMFKFLFFKWFEIMSMEIIKCLSFYILVAFCLFLVPCLTCFVLRLCWNGMTVW